MRFLLKPFSFIYAQIIRFRNYLYDTRRFNTVNFKTPIVSVGNITMGGTGKTPLLCELLRWALEKNLRPAVVSRGYRGHYVGVQRVHPDSDAKTFGDEPVMISNLFKNVPIYVGRDRSEAVTALLADEKVDVIFADDAFQHRQLGRSLDVVVIDCTEKIENYSVLPEGRGRESLDGLKRADFIILNKVNLVEPKVKQQVLELIEAACGEQTVPVIECEYYIKNIFRLDENKAQSIREGEKIALMTAIGQPSSLYEMLSKKFSIQHHYRFRDHHVFERSELAQIVSDMKSLNVDKIVVTQKDAVKLKQYPDYSNVFWVTELSPKLSLQTKMLYEKIISLTR